MGWERRKRKGLKEGRGKREKKDKDEGSMGRDVGKWKGRRRGRREGRQRGRKKRERRNEIRREDERGKWWRMEEENGEQKGRGRG